MTQAHWGQIQVLWDGGHGWRTRGCRKPWSLSPSLCWAPGSGCAARRRDLEGEPGKTGVLGGRNPAFESEGVSRGSVLVSPSDFVFTARPNSSPLGMVIMRTFPSPDPR